ncbi:hypothetical protein JW926_12090 [Candidatus Sumerlaeota bacterium]|nr:hypothetical protein [Candidatus Sumerlaeota bacterium]
MKKCLFLLVIFFSVHSMLLAVPVWRELIAGRPPGSPPIVSVSYATTDTTHLNVQVPGYWEEEVLEGAETYTRFFLPSTNDDGTSYGIGVYKSVGEVGRSELPVIRVMLGISSNATTATIENIVCNEKEQRTLSYQVYPYQRDAFEEEIGTFEKDVAHYYTTDYYPFDYNNPAPPTYQYSIGEWHHVRVAVVELFPFFSSPASLQLDVLKNFDVSFNHIQDTGTEFTMYVCTALWNNIYEKRLVNYAFIESLLPPVQTSHKEKFRIYVAKGLETNAKLGEFIFWKKRQGYHVTMKTVGSGGDLANNSATIQTDIKNYYNANPCWDIFIQLIGDNGALFPLIYSYSGNNAASDYKYTLVKGSDDFGDLFIGRIPADNDSQLTNMLAKIMKYEKNPPQDNWLTRAYLASHKQDYPGKYAGCKTAISTANYSLGGPAFTMGHGGAGANDTNVINFIGATHGGIVNYRGHGSDYAWWNWNNTVNCLFNSTDIANINNGDYTPVVFSVACHNNKIGISDCVGESWLLQYATTYRGAVAHLGASNLSWTFANHEYDKNLFKGLFDDGVYQISPLSHAAHGKTMQDYKAANSSLLTDAKDNAYIYSVLGDPSMEIRTKTPVSFTEVACNKNPVQIGDSSFVVTVRDAGGLVSGATVTIEKPLSSSSPEFFITGRTDSLGKASFTIAPASSGNVYVTASKYNYIVWEGYPAPPAEVSDWPGL